MGSGLVDRAAGWRVAARLCEPAMNTLYTGTRLGNGRVSASDIVPGLRVETTYREIVLSNTTQDESYYVHLDASTFSIWASMEALLRWAQPQLNIGFLHRHLRFGEMAAHETAWAHVHLLLPGSRLTLGSDSITCRYEPWCRGWLEYDHCEIDDPASVLEAVLPCQGIDVILEFSGGTDSTAIAYAMAGRGTVKALTWADPQALSASDVQHARRIAGKLGLDHHIASLQPEALFQLPPGEYRPDRPSISLFMMSQTDTLLRQASAECSRIVVLNGHGGDHIFFDPPSPLPMVDLLLKGRMVQALRFYQALVEFHGQGLLAPLRYRHVGRGMGAATPTLAPGRRLQRRLIRQACYENSIWNNCGAPYRVIHPFTHPAMLRYAMSHPPHAYVGERLSRLPFRQAMNRRYRTEDFCRVGKGHLTGVFQRAIHRQQDALAQVLERGVGHALGLYPLAEMLGVLRRAALGADDIGPALMNALSLELFLRHWSHILGDTQWQTPT